MIHMFNGEYHCNDEFINTVEKGNIDTVEDINNTYIAFSVGKCPMTGKTVKLIMKGSRAFFVYTNFLEDYNTLSVKKTCQTTGIETDKKVRTSFIGNVKEERNKEIILIPKLDAKMSIDFRYTF